MPRRSGLECSPVDQACGRLSHLHCHRIVSTAVAGWLSQQSTLAGNVEQAPCVCVCVWCVCVWCVWCVCVCVWCVCVCGVCGECVCVVCVCVGCVCVCEVSEVCARCVCVCECARWVCVCCATREWQEADLTGVRWETWIPLRTPTLFWWKQ